MNIDQNSQAARVFWRMVRDFSLAIKPWETAIYYDINPDEIWDATLVSERVYGRRDEFMTVMAVAGIDSADEPLEQKQLILPNETQLRKLKQLAGFESRSEYREDGKPTWSTE